MLDNEQSDKQGLELCKAGWQQTLCICLQVTFPCILIINLGLDYLFSSTKDTSLLSQVIDERGQTNPSSLTNTVGSAF